MDCFVADIELYGLKAFALGGFICSFFTYKFCKVRMGRAKGYEIKSMLRLPFRE